MFYIEIEPTLNNYELASAYSDKNSYEIFLITLSCLFFVTKNKNGSYYNGLNKKISCEEAERILNLSKQSLIIKPSLDTGGGRNVILLIFERTEHF